MIYNQSQRAEIEFALDRWITEETDDKERNDFNELYYRNELFSRNFPSA